MAEFINPMVPNLGIADQAIAGAGGAILTGADRKIIKERVGEIDPNVKFTDLVKEMFNKTDTIDKVETGEKQEAGQAEDQKTRIKLEKRLIRYAPTPQIVEDRISISEPMPAPIDNYSGKIERPFDEYAVLFGQKLIGIPISEETLKYLEDSLSPEITSKIQREVKISLSELIATLVKESFYEKVRDPKLSSSLILKTKYSQYLLDYYSNRSSLPIETLIELIKELGISLDSIKKLYNLETVSLASEQLKIRALEEKKKNEIRALEESLKDQYVQMLLSDNIVDRYALYAGISIARSNLESLGVPKEKILLLIAESKKVAWLRSVVILKDLHLKRIFSTSKNDFEKLSSRIKNNTLRARKLGLRVSREGVLWVEAQIGKMAQETAEYKIKLLKSMQEMGFDQEREKDILWLTTILNHLKRVEA